MTRAIDHPTRRSVLVGGSVSLIVLGSASGLAAPSDTPAAQDGVRVLRAAPLSARMAPESQENAACWAFDGALPGPVVRARQGEEVRLRLANDTPVPLSLHWHGIRGPNAMDGVAGLTQPAVAPGGSFEYRFVPPDAGTFLIRPIVPGGAGEAAGRGLSGLLVVEEREPPKLDGDFALLVRDFRVAPLGSLEPFGSRATAAAAGRLGNRIDVAGTPAPQRIEVAPGARLRLRIANAANARIMRIRFDDLKVFVAAVDGQPTETFEPLRATLPFPPGTRYDVFVEAPAEAGRAGRVMALVGNGIALVEIVTKGAPVAAAAPVRLPLNRTLPAEIRLQNAVRAEIVIAGGATRGTAGEAVFTSPEGPIWTVNGRVGSATSPPLLRAPRGAPVVLGISNRTGFPQPLHLHGHVFRLLHALDDGWEPYWLDTFQVPEGKTLHIAFIADNPGRWMFGSTVLERLDTGLWTWLEVA